MKYRNKTFKIKLFSGFEKNKTKNKLLTAKVTVTDKCHMHNIKFWLKRYTTFKTKFYASFIF